MKLYMLFCLIFVLAASAFGCSKTRCAKLIREHGISFLSEFSDYARAEFEMGKHRVEKKDWPEKFEGEVYSVYMESAGVYIRTCEGANYNYGIFISWDPEYIPGGSGLGMRHIEDDFYLYEEVIRESSEALRESHRARVEEGERLIEQNENEPN